LNVGDKLGKQFGYADKLGIPYALVIGPDERAAGVVTVKRLVGPMADDRRPTTDDRRPNQETVERGQVARILLEE
jgi:histidyl-tRNA synthetase